MSTPPIQGIIRRVKGGFRLLSKKKNSRGRRKNLGTFPTRAQAERREKQVKFFKSKGKR